MQVLPFTITKSDQDAILLQEDKQPVFYSLLHQHEELQISFIKQGEGSLLVGDSISSYKTGDFVILGGNLPHVFKSQESAEATSHMLTVFFTKESFGIDFFKTEELKTLTSFFEKAANGFKITAPPTSLIELFEQLKSASKLDRFIYFIRLLKLLNEAPYESLSSFVSEKKYTDTEGNRMSAVIQYTLTNFTKKISLHEIAREAAMTPNAFCKYFKKRTRKTYVEFLTELRIDTATQLLKDNVEMSIAEIAEESGFSNISNFNRKFKELKKIRPLEYRKQHASQIS